MFSIFGFSSTGFSLWGSASPCKDGPTPQTEQAAEKLNVLVILSEAKNLSWA